MYCFAGVAGATALEIGIPRYRYGHGFKVEFFFSVNRQSTPLDLFTGFGVDCLPGYERGSDLARTAHEVLKL